MTAAAIARMHVAVVEDRDEMVGFFAARDAAAQLAPAAASWWMGDASWWPRDIDPMPASVGERIFDRLQAAIRAEAP